MNERIRELWLSAAREDCGDSWDSQEQFIERFGLKIVQECMRMCEVTETSFETHGCSVEASGAITVKQFISDWFKVEE
jgi:hypothetical protein